MGQGVGHDGADVVVVEAVDHPPALACPHHQPRIAELAERLGLEGLFDARTGDLPGGTRQKVALTSALLHEPSVVFLDEPTAGVDPASRRAFWKIIEELSADGKTVLVTTHYLDEAEACHRVGLMVDGKLVALDTPAGLKSTHVPGVIRQVRAPRPTELAAPLRAREGVVDVQIFGRALHARLVDEAAARALDEWLGAHVPGATSAPARATLEDVFLAVVEAHGRGGAA